jgi:hypothetical protein
MPSLPSPRKIDVRIGAGQYTLVTGDDEACARRVATHADQLVRRILQANPSLNQPSALVLGLVNSIDEGFRLDMQVEVLEGRLAEAEGRIAEARTEMLRCKERLDASTAEMNRLRTQLERAERDARLHQETWAQESARRTQSTFLASPPAFEDEPERDPEG